MNFKKVCFTLFLCMFSNFASAGYQGGNFKVTSLRIGDDGVYVEFSPALAACNGGSHYRMHARVRNTISKNYDSIVSSLLTAYTAGQTFKYVWFNDLPSGVESCGNNGEEILELTMLEFSNK